MENINTTIKVDTPRVEEMENVEDMLPEKVDVDNSGLPLDPETRLLEKKLKLKLDLFILPLISMVYFFASMVNISLFLKLYKYKFKSTSRDAPISQMHK